jgi:DNA-binding response OmpR family regulator
VKAIIVDDSRYSSVSIKKKLKELNVEIIDIAFSVVDFEAFLGTVEKPDFVTMDMVLPDGDGIECCLILWKKWPGLPVLFISSLSLTDKQKAQLPHVIEYIIKPIDLERMKAAVDKIKLLI